MKSQKIRYSVLDSDSAPIKVVTNLKTKMALRKNSFETRVTNVEQDTLSYEKIIRRVPKTYIKRDDGRVIIVPFTCIGPEVVMLNTEETADKVGAKQGRRNFYCTSCDLISMSNPAVNIQGVIDHLEIEHPKF